MARPIINEKGNVYGDIKVIRFEEVRRTGSKGAYWVCKCKCGNEKTLNSNKLRSGEIKSCNECSKQNYIIYENYVEGKTRKGESFKIDINDLDSVSKINWYLRHGYVHNSKLGALHNFLIKKPNGLVVDHINGNRTDNRRINLRVVTPQLNQSNRLNVKGNTKLKNYEKYRAVVVFKGKRYNIGYFNTKEEAIEAHFNKKAELFNEELAYLNR